MTITITKILGVYTLLAVAALVIGAILKVGDKVEIEPVTAVVALVLSIPVVAFAILTLARQRGM
jgi:hypothetical protein